MTARQEGSTRLFRGELEKLGLTKHHPFYMSWVNMKTRCDNPKSTQYKWYGARGIHYCDDWKVFRNFYNDMFENWHPELMLDRRRNNEDYSYDNCRWVSASTSALNRNSKGYLNGDQA